MLVGSVVYQLDEASFSEMVMYCDINDLDQSESPQRSSNHALVVVRGQFSRNRQGKLLSVFARFAELPVANGPGF